MRAVAKVSGLALVRATAKLSPLTPVVRAVPRSSGMACVSATSRSFGSASVRATLKSFGSAKATAVLRSSGFDFETATILVATSFEVCRLGLRRIVLAETAETMHNERRTWKKYHRLHESNLKSYFVCTCK